MKISAACAVLIAISSIAIARLGENITQCDQRYNGTGANISNDIMDRMSKLITGVNTTNVVYKHDGWKIKVGYLNTYAVVIEYSRLDNGNIDKSQMGQILRINCGDETWSNVGVHRWAGSRGNRLRFTGHRLRIESAAYLQHKSAGESRDRRSPSPGMNL